MTKSQHPRAFVMVVVCMLVVALLAAVIGVQSIVQSQRGTAVRDADQSQARAVADRCIARARIYLDQLRNDSNPTDFDRVLDPNLDSHPAGGGNFSDDFVPLASFGGVVAYLPASEESQSGLRQALHRYRYTIMDGGGCFVRFDDNADDFRAAQSATPGVEGGGIDTPYRDTDMGIFISAVGIFPAPTGSDATAAAAATAYASARSRVTLKTFVNTGGAPGVVARSRLVVSDDIGICGQGGFQGDTLTYVAGGSSATVCSCGDASTTDDSVDLPHECNYASGTGTKCDSSIPCQPGERATIADPPDPDVVVPTPVHWLELNAFVDPSLPDGHVERSLGTNKAGSPKRDVCEFYFRTKSVTHTWDENLNTGLANDVNAKYYNLATNEFSEMFVWDHTDNDAQGCRIANRRLENCPLDQLVTHNCQETTDTTYDVSGKPVVKGPCRWAEDDDAREAKLATDNENGPTVQCQDPDKETPCWKLVARLTVNGDFKQGGRATVQQDYVKNGPTTCPSGLCVNVNNLVVPASSPKETTRNKSGIPNGGGGGGGTITAEVFSPGDLRVPNIEAFWGDPLTVNSTPRGAEGTFDPNTQNDGTLPMLDSDKPAGTTWWEHLCGPCPDCDNKMSWRSFSDEHLHFDQDPMCSDNFFSPSILVFENQSQDLKATTGTHKNNRFHVKANWGSAAGCGSRVPSHTIIVQGHADIDKDTRLCSTYSDCSTFPAPCARTSKGKNNGLLIRAGGECYIGNGAVFIGDMQCGTIHVNNGTGADCLVGNLIAFNNEVAIPRARDKLSHPTGVCPGPTGAHTTFVPDGCSRGFCAKQQFKMVGDIISDKDVCILQGAQVFGSVLGGGRGPGPAGCLSTTPHTCTVTAGSIYIEDNVRINGQLVSEGDIGIKSNAFVNNNGVGAFGTRVSSGIPFEGGY